jgi:hypothetical protein
MKEGITSDFVMKNAPCSYDIRNYRPDIASIESFNNILKNAEAKEE